MFEQLLPGLGSISEATFLGWMIPIGLTLLVLDVFLYLEIPFWIYIFVFAGWETLRIGLPIQWSILVFLLMAAAGIAVYYTIWVRFIRPLITGYILRKAPKEDLDEMVGQSGRVKVDSEGGMLIKGGDVMYAIDKESCAACPGVTWWKSQGAQEGSSR